MPEQNLETLADRAAELIINAKKVVVFTGAGISTESGIPDFRGPGGIWTKFDPDDFTYQKFVSSPETRRRYWQMFGQRGITPQIKPNPAHYAIAELDKLGKLDCVITQNIDSLHKKAGVPDNKVLELHGNMQWAVCLSCKRRYSFEEVKAKLDAGVDIPECEVCHGSLKPDVVFFGETLPERVVNEATARSHSCDLFIVIGSTLIVYPAAYMPAYAVEAGARLIIINLSPTPMDDKAILVIRAKAGEAMSRIIEMLTKRMGVK